MGVWCSADLRRYRVLSWPEGARRVGTFVPDNDPVARASVEWTGGDGPVGFQPVVEVDVAPAPPVGAAAGSAGSAMFG